MIRGSASEQQLLAARGRGEDKKEASCKRKKREARQQEKSGKSPLRPLLPSYFSVAKAAVWTPESRVSCPFRKRRVWSYQVAQVFQPALVLLVEHESLVLDSRKPGHLTLVTCLGFL